MLRILQKHGSIQQKSLLFQKNTLQPSYKHFSNTVAKYNADNTKSATSTATTSKPVRQLFLGAPLGRNYQLGKNVQFTVGHGNSVNFKVNGPLGNVDFYAGRVAPISDPSNVSQQKLFFAKNEDARTFLKNFRNAMYGVQNGFYVRLVLRGVGYRSWVIDNGLYLDLGNNHLMVYKIPPTVVVRSKKGKILIFGCNKSIVGQVAADIRSLRRPDPYKGKGILFHGQEIRLKQGKQR